MLLVEHPAPGQLGRKRFAGRQAERRVDRVRSAVKITGDGVRLREVAESIRRFWLEADYLGELLNRGHVLGLCQQDAAEIIVGGGVGPIDLDGLLVFVSCFVEPPGDCQRGPEIEMSRRRW